MQLCGKSTALVVLLIAFTVHLSIGGPADTKYQNHYTKNGNAENRQGLAGSLLTAVSSMLPVLPLVMVAPIAIAGLGPAVGYLTDAMSSSSSSGSSVTGGQNTQAISDVIQKLSSSNGGLASAFAQLAQKQQQQQQSPTLSASSSPSAAGGSAFSSIKKISQALGLSESTVGEPEAASSSIISSFFDEKEPSSSSSSTSALLSALASRPNSNSQGQGKPSSDLLGAAAAALDNAGLLGPISGAGTGSITEQILNLVNGNKGSSSGSSASASAPSTSALSSLLGLSSDASGSSPAANVYSQPSSGSPLQLPATSSPVDTQSNSNSGNVLKLANNAFNKISDFIFTRRRSSQSLPSLDAVTSKAKGGIFSYAKDVFSTLKDGVGSYEISESECQARLMCELNQKATGRSFKSWANSVFDLFKVEDYLNTSSFTSRTKSVAKDMLRAARQGLNEEDCAKLYARCPVHVVEATKNHIFAQDQALNQAHAQAQAQAQNQAQNQARVQAQAQAHAQAQSSQKAQTENKSKTAQVQHANQSNNNRLSHQSQPATPVVATTQPDRQVYQYYNNANAANQFKPIISNQNN